jgi:hypothetical protein
VRSEGLCQWKIPMIPSGIEPATFRFVAQYLNHCATISGPRYVVGCGKSKHFIVANLSSETIVSPKRGYYLFCFWGHPRQACMNEARPSAITGLLFIFICFSNKFCTAALKRSGERANVAMTSLCFRQPENLVPIAERSRIFSYSPKHPGRL